MAWRTGVYERYVWRRAGNLRASPQSQLRLDRRVVQFVSGQCRHLDRRGADQHRSPDSDRVRRGGHLRGICRPDQPIGQSGVRRTRCLVRHAQLFAVRRESPAGRWAAPGANIGLRIFSAAWTAFFYGGVYRMAVKQVRGEPISFGDIFSGGPTFLPMLGFNIVYGLASGIGLLFCLVPGFLIMGLLLAGPALVTDGAGVGGAISRSNDGMKVDMWNAAAFVFVMGLILVVSAVPCGLGLFVTVPMYWLISALAYRDMIGIPGLAAPAGPSYGAPQPGVWPPPPSAGQAPPVWGQTPTQTPPPARRPPESRRRAPRWAASRWTIRRRGRLEQDVGALRPGPARHCSLCCCPPRGSGTRSAKASAWRRGRCSSCTGWRGAGRWAMPAVSRRSPPTSTPAWASCWRRWALRSGRRATTRRSHFSFRVFYGGILAIATVAALVLAARAHP